MGNVSKVSMSLAGWRRLLNIGDAMRSFAILRTDEI
jgi:hypothetical protein